MTLADAVPIAPADMSMVIDRVFTVAPYLVVSVLATIAMWRFVVREWLDRREAARVAEQAATNAERALTHAAKNSELVLQLKIAEAHRDTSRSLEISSGTLRDLTLEQKALIVRLADHADRAT